MKKSAIYVLPLLVAAVVSSCEKPGKPENFDSFEGLVINEVCPAKTMFKDAWIEIYNPTGTDRKLRGMKVLLTTTQASEETVATLDGGEIKAGGYYVIHSLETEFSSPLLLSNFAEVAIADNDAYPVNAFSLAFDYHFSGRAEEGQSYARIPDVTGEWQLTTTPTPGEPNYKITPHNLNGLVINEVCPREHWVEVVNTGKSELQLEYSSVKSKAGKELYTAPAGLKIPIGGRIAVDCAGEDTDFTDITWYTNTAEAAAAFSAGSLKAPEAGGSWSRLPDITGKFAVSTVATRGEPNYSMTSSETGLVINEVAQSWIEISNSTLETIQAGSVKLYGVKSGSETLVQTIQGKTLKSHDAVSASVTSGNYDSFVLKATNGTVLDSFKKEDVHDNLPLSSTNSWSRIPDGTGKFFTVVTPTRDESNYGIQTGNTIGIWVNHSSMSSISLEEMCRLGIGNILIHEYVFRSDLHSISDTRAFFDRAHSLGMKVHIWMQCFWWNDAVAWRCPVIDATSTSPAKYNQELFDDIIGRAMNYINYEIDGVHFDYIRFPGTANKHNFPDDGITGTGAVTEFCRQISGRIRAKRTDIVISAALMGESGAVAYYGQDPEKMNAYIDVLLPMAYISSYGYTQAKNASVANWFADRSGSSQVWHGISTYNSNTQGLPADTIYSHSKNIEDNSRADGLVFFRYGLGTLPDMNAFYKK